MALFISLILYAAPLAYLAGSIAFQVRPAHARRCQSGFAITALIAAVAGVIVHVTVAPSGTLASVAPASMLLLLLIALIGTVISRYSENYLDGEPRENEYYQHLYATLAAASTAVVSNHMLILLAAWIAISLSLHRLLMFYPDRPRAAIAAHKKFLLARVAELSLCIAFVLLYWEHGTWQIDRILASYPGRSLNVLDHCAAVLLAVTALIKCAQLPIHGWLIQVVESPTPVSAMLHAGIINLGGYLLILFAPLFSQSAPALWLVLVVSGITTLLAGLIMLTRVSVKVRLAWSTTAQMGLMLVECALGLYELALLHLIAHSFYKAYAFLNSGTAVENDVYRRMVSPGYPSIGRWICALGLALLLITPVMAYFSSSSGTMMYSPWLLMIILLTLLFLQDNRASKVSTLTSVFSFACLLVVAYALQKSLAIRLVPETLAVIGWMGDLWFAVLITLLFIGYVLVNYKTRTAFGSRLWHLLYAGLYLDEWSTRVTLALWPNRLAPTLRSKHIPKTLLNPEVSS